MAIEEALSLQNELLQVQILPAFGGKISSLRSVQSGEEFLLAPLRRYGPILPSASFSESDGGGFDECLPSVASCGSISGEKPVPDHGDLWRLAWVIDSQDDGEIVLHADSVSRPLRLTRHATLQGSSLILDYDLLNLSDLPTTWLWSAHPLLCVNAGDQILLPSEVKEVAVDYSASGTFDKKSSIAWPLAKSTSGAMVDLSRIEAKDGVTAHKLFARMEKSGWSGLYRHKAGQGLVLRFDPSVLPYLGVWICLGAWPETGAVKQYTIALEPTTSSVDSLSSAVCNGTASYLGAHEHCRWRLELQLLGADLPLSFESFSAIANVP